MVLLLVSMLGTFSMVSANYLVSLNESDRDVSARGRAFYVAELGRAAAHAYVRAHPAGPWPYSRALDTVWDDRGAPSGQFTYTVTQPSGAGLKVAIDAYWPSAVAPTAACSLQIWLKRDSEEDPWYIAVWSQGIDAEYD